MARSIGFGLLALSSLVAAAPRPVTIRTSAGPCRYTLNGRHITLAELRSAAHRWRYDEPEIHFKPSVRSRYECVDAVLTVLKRSGVTKMGFIGTEEYPPGPGDQPK